LSLAYAFREAVSALFHSRFSGFLSVLVTAIAIFFIGVFAAAVLQGWQVLHHLKSQIQMEVFLEDNVSDDLVHALRLRLENFPEIDSVAYISKQQALSEFKQEFGQDVLALLGENPLPASFRLYLNPHALNRADIHELQQKIERWSGVDEVVYRYDLLKRFERVYRIGIGIAFGLGLFLLLVSIVLISHTTRLTVLAKQDNVQIMSLVGAKPSFIRQPFVLEGALQGFLGGILAVLALFVLAQVIHLVLPSFRISLRALALFLIVWSTFIGALGSYFGIRGILNRLIV